MDTEKKPQSHRKKVGEGPLLAVILAVLFMLFGGNSGGGGGYSDDVPSAPGVMASQPGTSQQTGVSANARPKRYVPLGNGKDTVTVMVYMCGTDLESNYGMATSDLQEMMNADIGGSVNVIVETGGCKM